MLRSIPILEPGIEKEEKEISMWFERQTCQGIHHKLVNWTLLFMGKPLVFHFSWQNKEK
jgi:hypothetical protein